MAKPINIPNVTLERALGIVVRTMMGDYGRKAQLKMSLWILNIPNETKGEKRCPSQ